MIRKERARAKNIHGPAWQGIPKVFPGEFLTQQLLSSRLVLDPRSPFSVQAFRIFMCVGDRTRQESIEAENSTRAKWIRNKVSRELRAVGIHDKELYTPALWTTRYLFLARIFHSFPVPAAPIFLRLSPFSKILHRALSFSHFLKKVHECLNEGGIPQGVPKAWEKDCHICIRACVCRRLTVLSKKM